MFEFFEMRFDLGTLDSGERSLPFGLLVLFHSSWLRTPTGHPFDSVKDTVFCKTVALCEAEGKYYKTAK